MCNFPQLHATNLCEHQTKAVFDLKLMVGLGEHKVVLDESGFSAYCFDVDWGLNFLCVTKFILHRPPFIVRCCKSVVG